MGLHPLLNLNNTLIWMTTSTRGIPRFIIGAINFVAKMLLNHMANRGAKILVNKVQSQFHQRIYTAATEQSTRLGNEMATLQVNLRIFLRKLFEIIPMGCRYFAIEQTSLSQQTDTGSGSNQLTASVISVF